MAQVQFQTSIRFADEECCRGRTMVAGTRYRPTPRPSPPSDDEVSPSTQTRPVKRCHIHFDPQQEFETLAKKHRSEQVSLAASKCRYRSPTPSPQDRAPTPAPEPQGRFKAKFNNLRIKTKIPIPNLLPPTPPLTSPLSPEFDGSDSNLRLPLTPETSSPSSPMALRFQRLNSHSAPADEEDEFADESNTWAVDSENPGLFKTISNALRKVSKSNVSSLSLSRPRTNCSDKGFNPEVDETPPPLKRAPRLDDAYGPPLTRSSTNNLLKTKISLSKSRSHQRNRSQSVPTVQLLSRSRLPSFGKIIRG